MRPQDTGAELALIEGQRGHLTSSLQLVGTARIDRRRAVAALEERVLLGERRAAQEVRLDAARLHLAVATRSRAPDERHADLVHPYNRTGLEHRVVAHALGVLQNAAAALEPLQRHWDVQQRLDELLDALRPVRRQH